jgi:hypothetical protein
MLRTITALASEAIGALRAYLRFVRDHNDTACVQLAAIREAAARRLTEERAGKAN